jgi:hypothetical protein
MSKTRRAGHGDWRQGILDTQWYKDRVSRPNKLKVKMKSQELKMCRAFRHWWLTPVILLGRLRSGGFRFKASLGR